MANQAELETCSVFAMADVLQDIVMYHYETTFDIERLRAVLENVAGMKPMWPHEICDKITEEHPLRVRTASADGHIRLTGIIWKKTTVFDEAYEMTVDGVPMVVVSEIPRTEEGPNPAKGVHSLASHRVGKNHGIICRNSWGSYIPQYSVTKKVFKCAYSFTVEGDLRKVKDGKVVDQIPLRPVEHSEERKRQKKDQEKRRREREEEEVEYNSDESQEPEGGEGREDDEDERQRKEKAERERQKKEKEERERKRKEKEERERKRKEKEERDRQKREERRREREEDEEREYNSDESRDPGGEDDEEDEVDAKDEDKDVEEEEESGGEKEEEGDEGSGYESNESQDPKRRGRREVEDEETSFMSHALQREAYNGGQNRCDKCGHIGTLYRCVQGCDFDICQNCHAMGFHEHTVQRKEVTLRHGKEVSLRSGEYAWTKPGVYRLEEQKVIAFTCNVVLQIESELVIMFAERPINLETPHSHALTISTRTRGRPGADSGSAIRSASGTHMQIPNIIAENRHLVRAELCTHRSGGTFVNFRVDGKSVIATVVPTGVIPPVGHVGVFSSSTFDLHGCVANFTDMHIISYSVQT